VGPPCLRQTALRAALRGSRSALALAHNQRGPWQHRKEAHKGRGFFRRAVIRLMIGARSTGQNRELPYFRLIGFFWLTR